MNKVDSEYRPLMDVQARSLTQLVLLLDDMHTHKLLGKRERAKLSQFVADTAYDLLAVADDAVLKPIRIMAHITTRHARRGPPILHASAARRPRRSACSSRCARSSANWRASCTPIAKPMRPSASAKRR